MTADPTAPPDAPTPTAAASATVTATATAVAVATAAKRRRLVLWTCLAGMFSTTFTATVLTVSIRTVATDLNSSVAVIAWSVTGAMFGQAVAMPILGRVGDIRGHRRTFLVGTTVAVVFSVATALAWGPVSLIAFRAVAQLAGAATIPASFAMLFMVFPPEDRVRPAAWASGVLSGASVTGLAIGGLVIESIGWRSLFLMQAGFAAVALIAAAKVLPADSGNRRLPLDKAGCLLLAAATFALTFGVNRAATWGVHPVVVGLLVAVPFLLWLLSVVERRTSDPVIATKLLRERDVVGSGVASFLVGGAHMGNFLVTPLLLQGVFGLSVAMTSLVTIARTLSISLATPSASILGVRFGPRLLAVVGGAVYTAALGVLAAGSHVGQLWMVIVGLVLSGLAFGHAQPPLLVIAGNAAPRESMGLSTSLQQTSMQIGAVIGMSLLSAIVADAQVAGPFVTAYLAASVLAAVAAVGAGFCRRRPAGLRRV